LNQIKNIGGEKKTGEKAVLLTNISSEEYKVILDDSFKFKYINISEIKGRDEIRDCKWEGRKITIPAHSVLLLELLD